jgi:hypothetical protein
VAEDVAVVVAVDVAVVAEGAVAVVVEDAVVDMAMEGANDMRWHGSRGQRHSSKCLKNRKSPPPNGPWTCKQNNRVLWQFLLVFKIFINYCNNKKDYKIYYQDSIFCPICVPEKGR